MNLADIIGVIDWPVMAGIIAGIMACRVSNRIFDQGQGHTDREAMEQFMNHVALHTLLSMVRPDKREAVVEAVNAEVSKHFEGDAHPEFDPDWSAIERDFSELVEMIENNELEQTND